MSKIASRTRYTIKIQ